MFKVILMLGKFSLGKLTLWMGIKKKKKKKRKEGKKVLYMYDKLYLK